MNAKRSISELTKPAAHASSRRLQPSTDPFQRDCDGAPDADRRIGSSYEFEFVDLFNSDCCMTALPRWLARRPADRLLTERDAAAGAVWRRLLDADAIACHPLLFGLTLA